jgi:hypothetical protein
MMHAAKAMAITAAQLIDDPDLLAQAKAEFKEQTTGYEYCAAIPNGAEAAYLAVTFQNLVAWPFQDAAVTRRGSV